MGEALGGLTGSFNGGDTLRAGSQTLLSFASNKAGRDAMYQKDLATYNNQLQSLELQKAQYLQTAEDKDITSIMEQLMANANQFEAVKEASMNLDEINLASKGAQAQVIAEAASSGITGNSVELAARAVRGKAAESASKTRFTLDSTLEALEDQKLSSRERARMQTFYYTEPEQPEQGDYMNGLFTSTLSDFTTRMSKIKKTTVDEETREDYNLNSTRTSRRKANTGSSQVASNLTSLSL